MERGNSVVNHSQHRGGPSRIPDYRVQRQRPSEKCDVLGLVPFPTIRELYYRFNQKHILPKNDAELQSDHLQSPPRPRPNFLEITA